MFSEPKHVWAVQLTVLPLVEELQTDPQTRAKWIDYSAYDAKATWQLAQALKKQLKVGSASLYPGSNSPNCLVVCSSEGQGVAGRRCRGRASTKAEHLSQN